MRYKRKPFFLCASLLLILMVLSGCSKSGKSEREIIKDLQESPAFISADIEINDYEIIKRQTDADNKTDEIYITVHANAPELTCSLAYQLKYELYNEGWILESVMRYGDGPWEFSGLSDEQLLADIKANDYYFSDWDLDVEAVEIKKETCDSNAMVYYQKSIIAGLTAHNSLFDYHATYNMDYGVVDGAWELQNAEVWDRSYTPTFSPDASATDHIVEELELGDGASATQYDSYEFLKADADWENRAEVRYYTATKDWWFGTETYLISIPLYFSLENGEDRSKWTYNANEIRSTLQSVDWNIEGWWTAYYSDDRDRIQVSLNIYNVIKMEGSSKLFVSLDCEADHWRTHFFAVKKDKCDTQGIVIATIQQEEPGVYSLSVDNPSEDSESNFLWNGRFDIIGNSGGDGRQGIYWVNRKLTMQWSQKDAIADAIEEILSTAETHGFKSYIPSNPICGMWKTFYNGVTTIYCFCPDGTLIYAYFVAGETFMKTSTYICNNTSLVIGEDVEWQLDWIGNDLFNMSSSRDQDTAYRSLSRIQIE